MAKRLLVESALQRKLYQGRGVPKYVLWGDYPRALHQVIKRVEIQKDTGLKTYTARKQLDAFEATVKEPLAADYIYAIGADNNDQLSSQVALKIFHEAMLKSGLGKEGRPYWHTLTGSTQDQLRDNREFSEYLSQMNLLVLANIAANSTTMKVEKLRDLLVKFSDIPRVVIINGAEPFKYFSEVLYMRPTRIMYFGRKD